MIELYPFQSNLIDNLRSAIRGGFRSPLLVSPTGSGKTVMFAYLTAALSKAGKRTMILAHRKELTDQISKTLKDFHVQHDLIVAGSKYNSLPLTHVASVFSVVRKLSYIKVPDYVIIDEAHHAIPGSTWNNTLDYWRKMNPRVIIVGVTATPERLSGEGLDHTFNTLIMGPTVKQLIKDGYLSPYKMFAPHRAVDMQGVKRRMGDFVQSETAARMDKPTITGDAIDHYKRHLNGAPTVGFCVSVEHAYHVAENYKANGFQAATIEGTLTTLERNRITSDFKAGYLNYMSSCDLVSEGYDVPGMMGCQNLRPTESLALCLQQWGRTLRYVPGKTAIILDHVGNSSRHGLPDMDREWTLIGHKKDKKSKDADDIAIKQCKECGAINPADADECEECGCVFEIKTRVLEYQEGELEEIKEAEKLNFVRLRAAANDLNALVEVGRMRGMKNPHGWARHVMAARERKRA